MIGGGRRGRKGNGESIALMNFTIRYMCLLCSKEFVLHLRAKCWWFSTRRDELSAEATVQRLETNSDTRLVLKEVLVQS